LQALSELERGEHGHGGDGESQCDALGVVITRAAQQRQDSPGEHEQRASEQR
jgi:hypothetical protein